MESNALALGKQLKASALERAWNNLDN